MNFTKFRTGTNWRLIPDSLGYIVTNKTKVVKNLNKMPVEG